MSWKLLALAITLFLVIDGFGQSKPVSIFQSGDTTGYCKTRRERMGRMEMRDPLVLKDSFLLRVSCENWCVEVWSADLRGFQGREYFFTKRYLSSEGRSGEELFKTKSMRKTDALAVYEAFLAKSIASVPSEKDIRQWPWGADGSSYLIEYGTPSGNSLKTYWQPSSARYHVREAAAIDDFIKEIATKLELSADLYKFLNKLPPGRYHTGGITVYTSPEKKRNAGK